jgi:hypothetical protein
MNTCFSQQSNFVLGFTAAAQFQLLKLILQKNNGLHNLKDMLSILWLFINVFTSMNLNGRGTNEISFPKG